MQTVRIVEGAAIGVRWEEALNRRSRSPESGATAVEFALVLPLLMLFLLGVIQYGLGLYQLQNFNSMMSNVSSFAGTGLSSCTDLTDRLNTLASQSGITLDPSQPVKLSWLTPNKTDSGAIDTANPGFTTTDDPQPNDLTQVTATFKPFRIGAPFIPFPHTITKTQTAPVQNLGTFFGLCGH